jgi:hypothetical protein
MRSDKMSSIYSAEVRNEFTTPDHHAGMRPGPLLFRGVLDLQSSRRMLMRSPFWVTDINKELLGRLGRLSGPNIVPQGDLYESPHIRAGFMDTSQFFGFLDGKLVTVDWLTH